MTEKKKAEKKTPKKKNRLQKGWDEFTGDVKKLASGKMEPRIFKKGSKKTVSLPRTGIARNMTGRGGDPVGSYKSTSPVQKAADRMAKKMTGKENPPDKKATKKRKGGKVTKKRTTKR